MKSMSTHRRVLVDNEFNTKLGPIIHHPFLEKTISLQFIKDGRLPNRESKKPVSEIVCLNHNDF